MASLKLSFVKCFCTSTRSLSESCAVFGNNRMLPVEAWLATQSVADAWLNLGASIGAFWLSLLSASR
eukprot:6355668-Amphidinium_carterae.1